MRAPRACRTMWELPEQKPSISILGCRISPSCSACPIQRAFGAIALSTGGAGGIGQADRASSFERPAPLRGLRPISINRRSYDVGGPSPPLSAGQLHAHCSMSTQEESVIARCLKVGVALCGVEHRGHNAGLSSSAAVEDTTSNFGEQEHVDPR